MSRNLFLTLPWIAKETLRSVINILDGPYTLERKTKHGRRLGERGLKHQLTVAMRPFDAAEMIGDPDEVARKRINKVAKELAAEIKSLKLKKFGSLPVNLPGCDVAEVRSKEDGIALRVVKQYDVLSNRTLIRFDMIGG